MGRIITFYLWEEGAAEKDKYKFPTTAKVDRNGIAKVDFILSKYASQSTWMSFFQNNEATKKFFVTAVYEKKKVQNKGAVVVSDETKAPTPPPNKPAGVAGEAIIKMTEIVAEGLGKIGELLQEPTQTPTVIGGKPEEKQKEEKKKNGKCYCYNQGIIDAPCNGKGSMVTDKHFESLAKDIGVEANVFKAVAIVESGGRKSFVSVDGIQKAKILYERHYMYRFLKKIKTQEELNALKKDLPDIVHNVGTYKDPAAKYGSEKEQFGKLKRAKDINNDYAIQSCSWGKFQVMGKYYNYLYSSPDEMEEAMNMCEVQHFAYFKVYLKDVSGAPMIKAMKEKNWNKIAELYNGSDYAINKYHTKMKNEYEKLEDK